MTILEVLENAEYNITEARGKVESFGEIQMQLGLDQLKNAIKILENGYNVYHDFNSLIEEFGNVDNIPEV